jgi:hypothetical protein
MIRRHALLLLASISALTLVPACSRRAILEPDPGTGGTGVPVPDAAASRASPARDPGDFYPLVAGNRWSYVKESYGEIHDLTGALISSGTVVEDVRRSIECATTYGGEDWQVQLDRYRTRGETTDRLDWVLLRQDRAGLYELEVVPTEPYPCGPLSALAGRVTPATKVTAAVSRGIADPRMRAAVERAIAGLAGRDALGRPTVLDQVTTLVRLAYPLHVGSDWAIRPEHDVNGNPTFTAIVEAIDALDLPAGRYTGFRIRIRSSFFGAEDSVLLWFGRAGFLALETHQTFDVRDENGILLGHGFLDAQQQLAQVGPPATGIQRIE